MTIKLTGDEFYEQFQEADEEEFHLDASDESDIVKKFDARIAQGWWREVGLREGILLELNKAQHCDRVIVNWPEPKLRDIYCCFTLSGKLQTIIASVPIETLLTQLVGKYSLIGNGFRPQHICDCSNVEPYSEIQIKIEPETLRSFAVSSEGELPVNLQHLIKAPDQVVYARSVDTQPRMATVLQQIWHCPYQGIVKRSYLESKAIELMALVLDHEVAIQQGEVKTIMLKPEQLERVHYAKEILLRDLSNPPSLVELARQVGLNDFLLKQGFRQAFGTTVFGELQAYRLETAKKVLAEQDISVTEVARLVGYANARSFARAFRRKFGVGPKAYQKACR